MYFYEEQTIYHNYLGNGEWIIEDREEQYNSKEKAIQAIDNYD